MASYPIFSIAIPTFNSERTLRLTLESIIKQTYPKNKIEILIIDGGSTDQTLKIAKEYPCRVLKNVKTELIYAKHIAFMKAKGKYLMYLDSDEVLGNLDSLKIKYRAFQTHPKVKSVFLSGYKTPVSFMPINNYSNEFGEPFSFFIYHESKGDKYLLNSWLGKYKKVLENKDCAVFDFTKEETLPIIELWAGGCSIDLEYARNAFPEVDKNPDLVAHLFYMLNEKGNYLAITKSDPTVHYSSENIARYLKKINSRIQNNIYNTPMGDAGFMGRELFQPLNFRLKKYLFPLYSFSLLLPVWDSIKLGYTRRQAIYLMHFPLTLYTASLILFYLLLKSIGISPKIRTYGR